MNIGIDIRPLMTPTRTGVGEYTFELLNAIFDLATDHRFFLFYNSFQDFSKYIPQWNKPQIEYISTTYPNKLFNTSQLLLRRPRLDRLIGKKNILKINAEKLDIFFSPNPNFTSLSKNIPHIVTIHDLSFVFFPEYYTFKQRIWHRLINPKKQCHAAKLIFTPSENTKRDLMQYYQIPQEKINVLYPGLSESFKQKLLDEKTVFSTSSTLSKKYHLPQNYILSFGSIEPRKNLNTIVSAFELARSTKSLPNECHLVISGSNGWKNRALFKKASSSPYAKEIHIIPSVSMEEKIALYKNARLFMYPSFYEGFGLPLLEAGAAGIPLIVSNRSSLPEVIGSNAYLINPHKVGELAEGMHRILSSQKIQDKLRQDSFQHAATYTWKKAAESWIKTIESIAGA